MTIMYGIGTVYYTVNVAIYYDTHYYFCCSIV